MATAAKKKSTTKKLPRGIGPGKRNAPVDIRRAGRTAPKAPAAVDPPVTIAPYPNPTPTLPPGTNPSSGPTPEQRDANAYLSGILNQYGLDSLNGWAWDQIVNGASPDEVIQSLRGTDAYKNRFKGMDTLRAQGRAISENEWISYERTATQMMRASGLPSEMASRDRLANLITNDVSVAELQQRVQRAEDYVYQHYDVDAARIYGLDPGDLVAHELNPGEAAPILERKFRSAQAAHMAAQTGYGNLNLQQAEQVGGYGLEPGQVEQGFNQLAGQQEVFQPLDQGEQNISAQDQIGAQFGQDANAQERIRRQAQRRVAQFQGAGAFSAGQRGYSGLG